MTRPRLHGTDGIRGRIEQFNGDDESALNALIERRILSNRSMRIIGEATGLFLTEDVGESPLVIIGWDRRDGNGALVDACLLYTSPSPRDRSLSRMPSSA